MAERSFKQEVETLRLPAGSVFRGEGILAVTKALLESGVAYVSGYQGAPISHLMDVLADAQDILADNGIHFEHSASEATAAATLARRGHLQEHGGHQRGQRRTGQPGQWRRHRWGADHRRRRLW
jgi:TPP-dependent indolepyruvate ferredoxin oxidoreductase alpha subunit